MFFKRCISACFVLCALLLNACGPAAAPIPTTIVAPTGASLAPTIATPALSSTTAVEPTLVTPTAGDAATPAAGAVTITDAMSRTVTFVTAPQRIVSLAPSNTEIIYALALGPKLVAVDDFSDYPPEAKQVAKIGGSTGKYNIEQIVALKPDLVLAGGITAPQTVKQLEDLKLPVVVIGSPQTTFASIAKDIALVGTVTRQDAQASSVSADMQQRLAAVQAKVAGATSKPRVYWELDATDATKPYTVGKGSFVSDMIALAGGENVFDTATSPYPQISAEQVIAANPQAIVMTDAAYGITVDSLTARPGWNGIAAVQQKQIYPIDDNIVSRPGPRVIEGLEAVAKALHPELFP